MPQKLNTNQIKRKTNEAKFFHKHIVEGKGFVQSAREMGVSKVTASSYKKSVDFRQMAVKYLEDSTLGGVKGTMGKLVTALDAVRPHNKIHKTTDKDGVITERTEVEWVPDTNARMKALQEVHKIYGLYAPQKRDIEVTISISSDAELFTEIDEAQRACKFIDSYEEREGSFELAPDPQGDSNGDFESRQRTLLQGTPVP